VTSVAPSSLERRARILLWGLVVCGAGLRFYGLEIQSLWVDELTAWFRSREPTLAGLFRLARGDVHPPGHALLLFAVQRCCGDSETWLRLPSAVAGVLSIPVLYAFVRRLFGVREALIAALLLAFGATPVAYSQMARPYALLLLGACVSGVFWLDALRGLQAREPLGLATRAGFVLGAVATAYLHYFGLLLVALQCLALIALSGSPARASALVASIAAAGLPWLPALLEDVGRGHFWAEPPDLGTLADTWRFLFRRPEGLAFATGLACALDLARRLARLPRSAPVVSWRARLTSPIGLVLLWLVAPVAIAFALSRLWMPVLTTRNLIVLLPAAYALCARSLCDLFPSPRAFGALGALLASALLIGLLWTGGHYSRPRHEQFREAAAVVVRHESSAPGATLLAFGAHAHHFDYYLAHLGARARVDLAVPAWGDSTEFLRHLDAQRPDSVWLLAARREPSPELLAALEVRFRQVLHEELHRTSARLYTRRRSPRRPDASRSERASMLRAPRAWRRSAPLLRSHPWRPRKSSIAPRSSASARSCATASTRSAV
jgi:hypothetical protein